MDSIDIIKVSEIEEYSEFLVNKKKEENNIFENDSVDDEDDDEEIEESDEDDFAEELESLPNAHSLFDTFNSKKTQDVWHHMKEKNNFDLSRLKMLIKSLKYDEYATIKLINFFRKKQKLAEDTQQIWKIVIEFLEALSNDEYLVTQVESDKLLWDFNGAFIDEESDEDDIVKKREYTETELSKKNKNFDNHAKAAEFLTENRSKCSHSSKPFNSTNDAALAVCSQSCNSDFQFSSLCTSTNTIFPSVFSSAAPTSTSSLILDSSTTEFTYFPKKVSEENEPNMEKRLGGGGQIATTTKSCFNNNTSELLKNTASNVLCASCKNCAGCSCVKNIADNRQKEMSVSRNIYVLNPPVMPKKCNDAVYSSLYTDDQAIELNTFEETNNTNISAYNQKTCSSSFKENFQLQKQDDSKDKFENNKLNLHENIDCEDDYIRGYSDLEIHRCMILDSIRTNAYFQFIMKNKHLFKDKVVLDVGCGSGILSFFCAKANAKKVIGIDVASETVKKAKQICCANALQNITFLCGKLEDVTLFEDLEERIVTLGRNETSVLNSNSLEMFKCDIIVSEWMGYCLLYESMIYTVLHARDKYLREGGLIVPSHAVMRMCAADLSESIEAELDVWKNPLYEIDMSLLSPSEKTFLEAPRVLDVNTASVVSQDIPICLLNLYTIKPSDLSTLTAPFSLELLSPEKVNLRKITSLVLYFDCIFSALSSVDICNSQNARIQYFFNAKPSFIKIDEAFEMLECLIAAEGTLHMSTKPFEDNKFSTHWRQTVIHLLNSEKTRLLLTNEEDRITGLLSISRHPIQRRHLIFALQMFDISCCVEENAGDTKVEELRHNENHSTFSTVLSNRCCEKTPNKKKIENLVAYYELH